jgi:ribonuclease HI
MEKEQKSWERMFFKENKAWVEVDANNEPIVNNGKVQIKYNLKQDYEYSVNISNISIIDESKVPVKKAYRKKTKKKASKVDSYDEIPPDNAICIYTDGASSGNPGPSGIGALLRSGSHEKEISRYIGHATNNIAELEAIKAGLLEIKKRELPVWLYTDSAYAYGLLVLGWKPKKNQELIQSIRELVSEFKSFKLIKVKGHSGHEGNERADVLATSAIKNAGNTSD